MIGINSVNGWQGGSLRVVSAFGEVYFGPWSGPRYSRATASFSAPFVAVSCKNDEKLYIAYVYQASDSTTSFEIRASSEESKLAVTITRYARFCASSGTYIVTGNSNGAIQIMDNVTRETRTYQVSTTTSFTLPFCPSGHFCPPNATQIRCDSFTCPGIACQPGKYGNSTTGCISCPLGKYSEIKFNSYYYNRSPYAKCPISINSFHACEAAAQYLFAPDSFIEIKNDVMVNHPNPDFNELKDDSWGRNVIFQINRSTYPKGAKKKLIIK